MVPGDDKVWSVALEWAVKENGSEGGDAEQVKELSGHWVGGPSQAGKIPPCRAENQALLLHWAPKAFCCPLCPPSVEGYLLQAGVEMAGNNGWEGKDNIW